MERIVAALIHPKFTALRDTGIARAPGNHCVDADGMAPCSPPPTANLPKTLLRICIKPHPVPALSSSVSFSSTLAHPHIVEQHISAPIT